MRGLARVTGRAPVSASYCGTFGSGVAVYDIRGGQTPRRLYISVDESGNVGDTRAARYFVLAASVVSDYDGYTRQTKRQLKKLMRDDPEIEEVKFYHHPSSREPILCDVQDSIDYVVYIAVPNIDASRPAKHMMAARSLQRIADFILQMERGDLFVELDNTNMIGDGLAESIFERNPRRGDRDIEAESRASRRRLGLQTQDFITGAIARAYNRSNLTYFALMTADTIAIITHDEWNRLFTDGISDELRQEDSEGKIALWEDWYNNPEEYTKNGEKKTRGRRYASQHKAIPVPNNESTQDYLKNSGRELPKRDAKGRFVSNGNGTDSESVADKRSNSVRRRAR